MAIAIRVDLIGPVPSGFAIIALLSVLAASFQLGSTQTSIRVQIVYSMTAGKKVVR